MYVLPLCIDSSPPLTPWVNQMPTPSHAGMFRAGRDWLFCRHNHDCIELPQRPVGLFISPCLPPGAELCCVCGVKVLCPLSPDHDAVFGGLADFPLAASSRCSALQRRFVPMLPGNCCTLFKGFCAAFYSILFYSILGINLIQSIFDLPFYIKT